MVSQKGHGAHQVAQEWKKKKKGRKEKRGVADLKMRLRVPGPPDSPSREKKKGGKGGGKKVWLSYSSFWENLPPLPAHQKGKGKKKGKNGRNQRSTASQQGGDPGAADREGKSEKEGKKGKKVEWPTVPLEEMGYLQFRPKGEERKEKKEKGGGESCPPPFSSTQTPRPGIGRTRCPTQNRKKRKEERKGGEGKRKRRGGEERSVSFFPGSRRLAECTSRFLKKGKKKEKKGESAPVRNDRGSLQNPSRIQRRKGAG